MADRKDITQRAAPLNLDLSHLKGSEIEKVATALGTALSAGTLSVLLANSERLAALEPEQLANIGDLAEKAGHCGGYGCG